MAATTERRPLADLEMESILAVDKLWEQRAHGLKPWTTEEYLDRIDRVHAHYNRRREWLRTHPQEVAA